MTRAEWETISDELGESTTSLRSLTIFVVDVALIGAAWNLGQIGWMWTVPAIVVQTFPLVQLYLLHHEAVHRAVFRSAGKNEAIGHTLGWLLIFPFLPRQRSHTLHHIWTGHSTGDPANDRAIRRFGDLSPEAGAKMEKLWRAWFPFLVINDRIGLWREPFMQLKQKPDSAKFKREARWARIYVGGYVLACGAMIATGTFLATMRYLLPAMFLAWMVEELLNLPHHAETPLINSEKPLPFWEQHLVTHACADVPVWSSLFILHFNLHIAHHAFPWVAWEKLPKAQALMALKDSKLDERRTNEVEWSWVHRRQHKFLDVMGHYFIVAARERSFLKAEASPLDVSTLQIVQAQ